MCSWIFVFGQWRRTVELRPAPPPLHTPFHMESDTMFCCLRINLEDEEVIAINVKNEGPGRDKEVNGKECGGVKRGKEKTKGQRICDSGREVVI